MTNFDLITLKESKNNKKQYSYDNHEAYRHLRTNIEFSAINADINVLAITSANASEGKSTTAANLAVVMASQRQRVLVIDTDLRIPELHNLFQLSNRTGLTKALIDFKSEDFSILKYINKITHKNILNELYVMTAGPQVPNPTEMLSSKRFKEFIELARLNFDMIIMDGPPVLPVPDAIPVGLAADGLIFCIASEQTRKDHAKIAVTSLNRAGIKVIGTVITMIRKENSGYYNSYYKTSQQKATTLGQRLKNRRRSNR